MNGHDLKYRASISIEALKKMCAMVLVWVLKIVCHDTPVLMANNTIGNSGKVYVAAAMMPFAMVPVDDSPLLGYALANKNVNASYNLTASNNDDVYMDLMNGDPYTSAEQKQRDLYEINDTDWHSVSFKGVYSSSVCHLAMHQDWITQHGYVVDAIVNMNLPEQGISGQFRITAIKHILPQKKPESDPGDDYEWKPVTGLFIHQSDQVHNISFDSDSHRNETIGVTAPHPIYSTTYNDWRLAGELEVGEKVLTYHGEATVTKTEKKGGSEAVYNLEIKDLHNFLVGDVGVVVHNTGLCSKAEKEFVEESGELPDFYITKQQALDLGWNPSAGNLQDVAPGKWIGGDIFRNLEGKLPNKSGRIWKEADINYEGGHRGAARVVFSNDGLYYETLDHYQTFTKID